ncbi:DUF2470 domain-containing protein [Patulibacter brassicae]|uniref:DUF2470 domain-containing protein n=1 Tax=Patulibacter brassicae TaxID=1705717 RepID=A0ABU4VHN8_9ACTN|nr:DUF2470 domain-containing protein [Patulibacter brassicae]MDX8151326.1 DUF2470 domain-containing protein [Patulibacter brassicae]
MPAADTQSDHQAPAAVLATPDPTAPVRTPQDRPSAAEEARTIVAATKTGTLASLSEDGTPWASMVAFATLADGRPVLMVSTLAEHGRNLEREQRASLSVVTAGEEGADPLDNGRVTLAGVAERVEGAEAEAARAAYVAAVPPAALFSTFGDFSTWVLRVDRVRWVGGYGRMDSVTTEQYLAAEPDPVLPRAAGAVRHLNDDHADALLAMARALGGHPDATSARCVRADRYGLDLRADTPAGRASVRVGFAAPLDDAQGLRAATVALARQARAAD